MSVFRLSSSAEFADGSTGRRREQRREQSRPNARWGTGAEQWRISLVDFAMGALPNRFITRGASGAPLTPP